MYSALVTALKASTVPFAEFAWEHAPQTGDYAVVAPERTGKAVWADGAQLEASLVGTIDLFARSASHTSFDIIQNVLKAQGVSWYLNSIQYENANKLVHYEWVFELEEF